MSYNDWLQSVPEKDQLAVAENPQFTRLLREAYMAGRIHTEVQLRDDRRAAHASESLLKRAAMR